MKYSKAYQKTRDIDWFFRDGDRFIHAASNGGSLPDFVNDMDILRPIQTNVALMTLQEGGQEVVVNNDYVEQRFKMMAQLLNCEIDSDSKSDYIRSFSEMAQKGFYSYDRDLDASDHYSLVCYPQNSKDLAFGQMIPEISPEISFDDNERKSFRINDPSYL